MHKESTLALWRGRLAECERCGWTDEEYCEASGVSMRMLRLWRRRLSVLSSPLELLEVPPPPSASSRAGGEDSRVSLEARELAAILAGVRPARYYRRHGSSL